MIVCSSEIGATSVGMGVGLNIASENANGNSKLSISPTDNDSSRAFPETALPSLSQEVPEEAVHSRFLQSSSSASLPEQEFRKLALRNSGVQIMINARAAELSDVLTPLLSWGLRTSALDALDVLTLLCVSKEANLLIKWEDLARLSSSNPGIESKWEHRDAFCCEKCNRRTGPTSSEHK